MVESFRARCHGGKTLPILAISCGVAPTDSGKMDVFVTREWKRSGSIFSAPEGEPCWEDSCTGVSEEQAQHEVLFIALLRTVMGFGARGQRYLVVDHFWKIIS